MRQMASEIHQHAGGGAPDGVAPVLHGEKPAQLALPLARLALMVGGIEQEREWQGELRWFFSMQYGSHTIWGATAGMLVNLARHLSQGRL